MKSAVQIPVEALGTCRSCTAPVIWVTTERGKKMPLDREEVLERGALLFVIDEKGVAHRFPELQSARIAYLFRETMAKGGDRVQLGHASKASAKVAFLAHIDFVIELNWTAWRELTPNQRVALMDHEISHCGRDIATGKWVIIHPDVEEFGNVVRRWGLWKPDLQQFNHQLELFGKRAAA